MDANDNGGQSPFPRLSQLEPDALEYAFCYRDRCPWVRPYMVPYLTPI